MEMNRTKGQTTNRGTGRDRRRKDGYRAGLHRTKQYEELTFTDDFLFCKILTSDKALCIELLEVIFGKRVRDITYVNSQQELRQTKDAKGIRLDVYLEDDEDSVYDIEMQVSLKKDIPRRSRYYQGMVDLNLIWKGESYNQLKKCYVIFISPEDLFPEVNLPVYTFENRCREMPELALGDEAYKIFLNAGGNAEGMSEELAAFLRYIRTNEVTDAFTRKLDGYVRKAVEHKEWRLEYMTLQQKYREEYEAGVQDGIERGIERGRAQGKEQGLQSAAVRLFRMQMPVERIAQAVGESQETVEKWLAEEGGR